jgi:fucose permease
VHVNPPLSRWLFACMSAIVLATLVLSLTSHEALSIAAGALIGFACGPIFPWLIAETPQRLGTEHGANAIGVQIASAAVGLTLAPTVLGTIGDEFGVNAIPFALLAIAAMLLVSFWMLERCRPEIAR